AAACLGKNEAAIVYVLGPEASYAIVLNVDGGLALVRLARAEEINEAVAALTDTETLRSPRARTLARGVYDLVLKPLTERVKGKDLLIVPSGSLCLLPFELLVEGEGEGRYLLERRRVRYAPSLTVLRLVRQRDEKRPRPDRLFWAVGDPVYEEGDPRLKG